MTEQQNQNIARRRAYNAPLTMLKLEHEWNPRNEGELLEGIESLKSYIRENFKLHGGNVSAFLPDWYVRKVKDEGGNIQLLVRAGFRRTTAFIQLVEEGYFDELGLTLQDIQIPISYVREGVDEDLIPLTENEGSHLTPRAQAFQVERIIQHRLNDESFVEAHGEMEKAHLEARKEVSRKWGKTLTHINNLLAFHEMPEDIQSMVGEGRIAFTTAVEAYTSEGRDGEALQTLLQQAVEEAGENKKVTAKHIRAVREASQEGGEEEPMQGQTYGPHAGIDIGSSTGSAMQGQTYTEPLSPNENEGEAPQTQNESDEVDEDELRFKLVETIEGTNLFALSTKQLQSICDVIRS